MLNGRERINQQRTATGKVSSYPSNISFGTSRDNKSKVTMSSPGTHSHDDDIEVRVVSLGAWASSEVCFTLLLLLALAAPQYQRKKLQQQTGYASRHKDCARVRSMRA